MFSRFVYNIPYILFFIPILFSIGTCLVENKKFNILSVISTLFTSSILLFITLLKLNNDSSLFVTIKGVESLIGGEFRINSISILFALAMVLIHIFIFLNTNYEFLNIDKKKDKDVSHRKYFFMTYLLNIFSLFGVIFTSNICNYFIFLELYSFTMYTIISDYKNEKDLKNSFNYFLNSICGSVIVLLSIFFLCLFFNSHRMIYIMQRFLTTNISTNIALLLIVILFFIGLILKFFSLDIIFYKNKSKKDARNLLSFLVLFINSTLSAYSILYFLKYLFNVDYLFNFIQVKTVIVTAGTLATLYSCYNIIKCPTLYNFVKKITNICMSLIVVCIGLNDKSSMYLSFLFIFEHLTSDFMIYLFYNYLFEKYNESVVHLNSRVFYRLLFVFLLCLKMFLPIGVLYHINSTVLFDLGSYNKYLLLVILIITKITYLIFLFKNFNILEMDDNYIEYDNNCTIDIEENSRKIKVLEYSMFSMFIIMLFSTFFVGYLRTLFI